MTAIVTERPAPGPVLVQLTPRQEDTSVITFVADLETIVESEKCSCNAGDDNPY
ncbi:hypothetical protein ABZY06_28685 [Streptomyces sp. NPDC006540]|jgi:hypothetical protein|uniref:hypothetical protein n=1 Tax=Streptomyces sp. NPDC006540 TaxID=3155353 RepID=UPI0033AA7470